MNKWKQELSPEIKKILKDINDLKKIDKDVSYLAKNEDSIPETHQTLLKRAYYDAIRCQLLIIHSSLDKWLMDGANI